MGTIVQDGVPISSGRPHLHRPGKRGVRRHPCGVTDLGDSGCKGVAHGAEESGPANRS